MRGSESSSSTSLPVRTDPELAEGASKSLGNSPDRGPEVDAARIACVPGGDLDKAGNGWVVGNGSRDAL